jgi:hypothetical protein
MARHERQDLRRKETPGSARARSVAAGRTRTGLSGTRWRGRPPTRRQARIKGIPFSRRPPQCPAKKAGGALPPFPRGAGSAGASPERSLPATGPEEALRGPQVVRVERDRRLESLKPRRDLTNKVANRPCLKYAGRNCSPGLQATGVVIGGTCQEGVPVRDERLCGGTVPTWIPRPGSSESPRHNQKARDGPNRAGGTAPRNGRIGRSL